MWQMHSLLRSRARNETSWIEAIGKGKEEVYGSKEDDSSMQERLIGVQEA